MFMNFCNDYDEVDEKEKVKYMMRRTIDELGTSDTLHAVLETMPYSVQEDIFEDIIAKYEIEV